MDAGLTALPSLHAGFGVPFDWQHKIALPYPYRNPVGTEPAAIIAALLAELDALAERLGTDRIGAFFVKPIQGSGGVVVPPPGWLRCGTGARRVKSCSSPMRSSPALVAPVRYLRARTRASGRT